MGKEQFELFFTEFVTCWEKASRTTADQLTARVKQTCGTGSVSASNETVMDGKAWIFRKA